MLENRDLVEETLRNNDRYNIGNMTLKKEGKA
jgi:hypothetical protein